MASDAMWGGQSQNKALSDNMVEPVSPVTPLQDESPDTGMTFHNPTSALVTSAQRTVMQLQDESPDTGMTFHNTTTA